MAEKYNIRELALDTLIDMERTGRLSHIAIGEALVRLQYSSKQDRAFFTLLCEGTTEQRIYLDYVLDQFSHTKMRKCKPLIRNLLRMSAYQILFTAVRDAAACNEAVSIARKRGFRNLSGFVNGVLRTLVRQKLMIQFPDREADLNRFLSVRFSMPQWIVEELADRFGPEKTEDILAASLKIRPVTIRTNLSKICPEELAAELGREGITAEEAPWFPYAFHISDFDHIRRIPAFRQGLFSLQDISAMLPVAVADPAPGDFVIDVCAAPGGKALHAADLVGPSGRVLARDLTEYKTDLIRENNERTGFSWLETEVWDARKTDGRLAGKADLVIADLPCSGLGIMGRKNDIKYHVTRERIHELADLQREILSAVWPYVRPGGQLVFSTCTLTEEENEANVRWLTEHTPLKPVSIEDKLPLELTGRSGSQGMIQILPGLDEGDGFFVAKFCRLQE